MGIIPSGSGIEKWIDKYMDDMVEAAGEYRLFKMLLMLPLAGVFVVTKMAWRALHGHNN